MAGGAVGNVVRRVHTMDTRLGIATRETSSRFPVRLLESGPAAGAIAAADAVNPASSMWMIETAASLVSVEYRKITAETVVIALTKR